MSLKRRILPVRRPKAIGNTDRPLMRTVSVSPSSSGLRVNIDGCTVTIARDGDAVVVTTSMPTHLVSTVNASEQAVTVKVIEP